MLSNISQSVASLNVPTQNFTTTFDAEVLEALRTGRDSPLAIANYLRLPRTEASVQRVQNALARLENRHLVAVSVIGLWREIA